MNKLILFSLITLNMSANLNIPEDLFHPQKPESKQEDILKARKGERFPKRFRALVLKASHEDARSYLESAKQHFNCIQNPSCQSDFVENRKVIVGPTGAGKTTLAQVIAEELGVECVVIDAALLSNEYLNSAINNFARAITPYIDRPCVLVLDEIDAILKALGANNPEQKVPQQIWQILDRLEKMPHVLVIGTTNSLQEIPFQLRSRFEDNLIESPKEIPQQIKKEIISYYLGDRTHNCSDKELDQIVTLIPAFFSRGIEKLVKGAIVHAKNRKSSPFLITKIDFEESLKKMKAAEKYFEKEKEGFMSWIKRKGSEGSNSAFAGVCFSLGAMVIGVLTQGKGGTSGGGGQQGS